MLRTLLCSAALVAVCVAAPTTEFRLFKLAFGKKYADVSEENLRERIYLENKNKIDVHNARYAAGEVSFTLAINQFSDLLHSEFSGMMTNLKSGGNRTATAHFLGVGGPVPDSYDCREHGLVTPVKNQGQCGSCWAFGVTGAMEGLNAKKIGILLALSESQLVDCASDYGNAGCSGGNIDRTFDYIKNAGGQEAEYDYPYMPEQNTCEVDKSKFVAHISGYGKVPQGDEEKLKEAIATIGPIAVAIDANQESFMHYSSGIYFDEDCTSTELDHAVLAVGYGTENGKDYWIVKNSWTAKWGEQGYIRMARNKDNHCGIVTDAAFPIA